MMKRRASKGLIRLKKAPFSRALFSSRRPQEENLGTDPIREAFLKAATNDSVSIAQVAPRKKPPKTLPPHALKAALDKAALVLENCRLTPLHAQALRHMVALANAGETFGPPLFPPARIGQFHVFPITIGFGSHGIQVLLGVMSGKAIAVKKLNAELWDLASNELSTLISLPPHSNLIQLFGQETSDEWVYIALELCAGSWLDVALTLHAAASAPTAEAAPAPVPHSPASDADDREGFYSDGDAPSDLDVSSSTRGWASSETPRVYSSSEHSSSDTSSWAGSIGEPAPVLAAETEAILPPPPLDAPPPDCIPATNLLCPCTLPHGAYQFFSKSPPLSHPARSELSPELVRLAKGLFSALAHIHAEHVVHGDVRPASVMVASDGTTRLGSFSQAVRFDRRSFPGARPSPASDVWQAAVSVFFLVTGAEPQVPAHLATARACRFDMSGVRRFPLLHHMLSIALHADPCLRPPAYALLFHPFFWGDEEKLRFLSDLGARFEVSRDTAELPSDAAAGGTWSQVFDAFSPAVRRTLATSALAPSASAFAKLVAAVCFLRRHYPQLPSDTAGELGPLPSGFLSYFLARFPRLLLRAYEFAFARFRYDPQFSPYFGPLDIRT